MTDIDPKEAIPFSDDGSIEIKLGAQVYRGNYMVDLKISEARFNEELKEQPSKYVFWSKMVAIQKAVSDRWRIERDRYEAQCYTFIRNEREVAGQKVTEKWLESKVRMDERYRKLNENLLRARLQLDLLESIQDAFKQRKDMLMSLGANLREEWGTSLSVKEKDYEEIHAGRANAARSLRIKSTQEVVPNGQKT